MTPKNHRPGPNHARRRLWGMLTLVSVLLGFVGILITISAGIHPQRNESFHHVQRAPYRHASDPITLALRGQPANSTTNNALPTTPAVRAIVVDDSYITLMAAGKRIDHIPYRNNNLDFNEVKRLVNDPAMIQETSSGQFVLKVALIVRNTKLTIGTPLVSEVHMMDEPSVFIGVDGGTLIFDTVSIGVTPTDNPAATWYQPFVMATTNATMHAKRAKFNGLGWDSNASYGVSWVEGSTGRVEDSVFERNFIGAYTSEANDMVFRHSSFLHNALYGLDPHTYSIRLKIDHVLAEGNRAHGIIFSDHVTDSTITHSTSRNNGENGIMMDEYSTGNFIADNTVIGNTGDGLVTAMSGHNTFVSNTVKHNRVGVRLAARDSDSNLVARNRIEANGLDSEGIVLDWTNTSEHNGGQWNWPVVRATWILMAALILLTALLLAIASRRRVQNQRPRLRAV